MLTDAERQTLSQTVELVWKKGTNHPNEAAVAFNFTKLVEKIMQEAAGLTTPKNEIFPKEKPEKLKT